MKLLLASDVTTSLPAILPELPGAGGRMLFIPTAAYGEGWEPERETHVTPFEKAGHEVTVFDLAGRSRADVHSALLASDCVYVCGGNTFHLVDRMRESGFAASVRDFLAAGGVYVGSSAGSVAAARDVGYAAALDAHPRDWSGDASGLGLVDFAVLPHLDHPEYGPRVRALHAEMARGDVTSLGLREDEVAAVEGRAVRVLRARPEGHKDFLMSFPR